VLAWCTRTDGARLSGVWAQGVGPADSSTTRTVGPWCQFQRLRSERPRPSRCGSPLDCPAAAAAAAAAAAMSPGRRPADCLDRQPWGKSRKSRPHSVTECTRACRTGWDRPFAYRLQLGSPPNSPPPICPLISHSILLAQSASG